MSVAFESGSMASKRSRGPRRARVSWSVDRRIAGLLPVLLALALGLSFFLGFVVRGRIEPEGDAVRARSTTPQGSVASRFVPSETPPALGGVRPQSQAHHGFGAEGQKPPKGPRSGDGFSVFNPWGAEVSGAPGVPDDANAKGGNEAPGDGGMRSQGRGAKADDTNKKEGREIAGDGGVHSQGRGAKVDDTNKKEGREIAGDGGVHSQGRGAEADGPNATLGAEVAGARTGLSVRTQAPRGRHGIQLGAFSSLAEAQTFVRTYEEALKRHTVYVLTISVPGKGVWHRVRLGAYRRRRSAERARRRLPPNLRDGSILVTYR